MGIIMKQDNSDNITVCIWSDDEARSDNESVKWINIDISDTHNKF